MSMETWVWKHGYGNMDTLVWGTISTYCEHIIGTAKELITNLPGSVFFPLHSVGSVPWRLVPSCAHLVPDTRLPRSLELNTGPNEDQRHKS